MFTVTTQATGAIRGLLASRPEGGLRLAPQEPASDGNSIEIALSVTSDPAPTDQVVALDGARVFIDEHIAAVLEDRTLDVYPSVEQGATAFRLLRQKRLRSERGGAGQGGS